MHYHGLQYQGTIGAYDNENSKVPLSIYFS